MNMWSIIGKYYVTLIIGNIVTTAVDTITVTATNFSNFLSCLSFLCCLYIFFSCLFCFPKMYTAERNKLHLQLIDSAAFCLVLEDAEYADSLQLSRSFLMSDGVNR